MENIYTIDELKKKIEPVAYEYGVKKMTLFGSYARDEASYISDVDFHLIDTIDLWGYFKLCGFKQKLEEVLGVSVDVLTTGSMDDEILKEVVKDEVLIYG